MRSKLSSKYKRESTVRHEMIIFFFLKKRTTMKGMERKRKSHDNALAAAADGSLKIRRPRPLFSRVYLCEKV